MTLAPPIAGGVLAVVLGLGILPGRAPGSGNQVLAQVTPQPGTGPGTGQVAGPMTGQVAGPVTGQVAGPVTGQVAGPVTGQVAGSVTGQLNEQSQILPDDGSYYNLHTFTGNAGAVVSIEMTSGDFDTYLILVGPDGSVVAQDDDGGDGTNSRIVVPLPSTGTYQIIANSYGVGETGAYTLIWQPVTAEAAALQSQQQQALQQVERLNQQVVSLYQAGRYGEAIQVAEAALDLQRQQLGERHPDVASSLNNLAVLYGLQGRYRDAEFSYQQALAILRSQLGENHLDVATSLNNLASLYQLQGRFSQAESFYQQTLEIRRDQLGEHHPDVATSLNNLAVLYESQGRYDEAESLLHQSLVILRSQLGEQHPDVAANLNNLAALYRAQGRYGEAEPLYHQSLAMLRSQLGDNHPDVAQSLNNLAVLYQAQGRYSEAEPLYQQSLAMLRSQLGERHPDVATSLNNLAALYESQGRYGEAAPLYSESLRIRQQQLGEDHPDVAQSLSNLAGLYESQGRYSEAEPLYQQSLAIWRQQLGEHHPDVATNLNNLAVLYEAQGRYSDAEPLYQQSLAIWRSQLGEHHPDVATSLNNLAGVYEAQGRYSEAEPLYQQSLEIRRLQLGDTHPDVAISLNNLAELYRAQGRYREAESFYQQSLAMLRSQLGETHPDVATNLNNLAVLYQTQRNFTQAADYLQQGLAIEESNLDLNLATLTEPQRQNYMARISGTTDASITFSLNNHGANIPQLGLTTLLRRKGRLLDTGINTLQTLRQNLTPQDQALLDNLTTLRQQLATLTFNPPATLTADQYRRQLAQLTAQANDLEATLTRRSAIFRAETQPVALETVQAQIPNNGVLVEYVRYRPFNVANPTQSFASPRYAAYLLFPNGNIQAIDLGPAAAIDPAIAAFIRLLQDPGTDLRASAAPTLRPDVVDRVTETLHTLILDPLLPHLADAEHLLISPDSQLNILPFEALPMGNGQYLVEQYQISYLNSGRDLLKLDITNPSPNPALILANPNYETAMSSSRLPAGDRRGTVLNETVLNETVLNENEGKSAGESAGESTGESAGERATALSQLQVGPLPGTAAEAAALRPLLPHARILTDTAATENALKQIQAPRILHIATHGFFLQNIERPMPDSRGIGVITADGSQPRLIGGGGGAVENPLLRSGLALAGFNARRSGEEDGVLTALEAASLNLWGTQLVVLSACETGLGDIANGEGVYGLRRAFAIAGAETQLMSLWQVSDFGTQSLMARYYDNLTAGMGRSEALRAVQLDMIASGGQYSHPYYWAAFILAGDWRPLE